MYNLFGSFFHHPFNAAPAEISIAFVDDVLYVSIISLSFCTASCMYVVAAEGGILAK